MKNPFAIMAAPAALIIALALAPGAHAIISAPQTANSPAPERGYILAQNNTQIELAQDDQSGNSDVQPEEAATPDVSADDNNESAAPDDNSATEDANQSSTDAGDAQPDAGVEPTTPDSNE